MKVKNSPPSVARAFCLWRASVAVSAAALMPTPLTEVFSYPFIRSLLIRIGYPRLISARDRDGLHHHCERGLDIPHGNADRDIRNTKKTHIVAIAQSHRHPLFASIILPKQGITIHHCHTQL